MEQFALDYPLVASILSSLYIVGVGLKILSSAAQKYVDSTVEVADDEMLVKIEASRLFKAIFFIVDLIVRFKPVAKKEVIVITEKPAA